MDRGRWIAICIVVFLVISLSNVFFVDRDVWFDEAFTGATVRLMSEQKIDFSSYDVHPPGSYLMQYVWSKANPGFALHVWLRLLSVFIGALFIMLVGFFAYAVLANEQAVSRSLLLVAIGTTFLQYATEARMYVFVMCLAAFACFAGVMSARERSAGWATAGIIAVGLLPLFHYMAFAVVPFIALVWWVIHEEYGFDRAWVPSLILVCAGVAGAAFSAIAYALPQLGRIGGLLVPKPAMMSLISGWFFGFQYFGDRLSNIFVVLSLIGVLLFGLSYVFVKIVMRRVMDWKMSAALFSAVFIVPAGLVWGMFFSYHHRYVLVGLWMAVFATYYVLFSSAKFKDAIFAGLLAVSILFVGMWMSGVAGGAVNPENAFKQMAVHIPCDADVRVVHETTFSFMPATQYAWERGCVTKHVLATQMEYKWAVGAGADVPLLRGDELWLDWTFNASKGDYVYVNVLNDSLDVHNRSCILWAGGGKLDEMGYVEWVEEGKDFGGQNCSAEVRAKVSGKSWRMLYG